MNISADPLACPRDVRRVKPFAPSLFPSPQRHKNPPVCGPRTDSTLSFFCFESLSSIKTLPKPIWNRFWIDFSSKNDPKIDPKSNQSQCRYSASFFNSFFIQNFMVHQTPDPTKSLKNHWFFQNFCTFNMWQLNVQFGKNLNPFWHQNWSKFHQKPVKKHIKLKIGFGNMCFLIFDCC